MNIPCSFSLGNLRRNWLFPIASLGFFSLGMPFTPAGITSCLIAFLFSLWIAGEMPSVLQPLKAFHKAGRAYIVLSAAGVCWQVQPLFPIYWSISNIRSAVIGYFPFLDSLAQVWALTAGLLGIFCVTVWMSLFFRKLREILTANGFFQGFTRKELLFYGSLLIGSFVYIAICFSKTDAFYPSGDHLSNDILYTCDTAGLLNNNAFCFLNHPENDLRQPLFAAFSAPFMGIAVLAKNLFHLSFPVYAMIMAWIQSAVMIFSNLMLSRMMDLSPGKRICFMIFTACSYTFLLFILIIEQYAAAYFYLILLLYSLSRNRRPSCLEFCGASGTLLTSGILVAGMPECKTPFSLSWLRQIFFAGLQFLLLLLALNRFQIFPTLAAKISSLYGFTGVKLPFSDRLYQYILFFRNLFLAPGTQLQMNSQQFFSWQLIRPTGFHAAGLLILTLVLISGWLNREKRSTRLALLWLAYSFVVMVIIGWGTAENGLILYSVYFGWPVMMLLFQLGQFISLRLRRERLLCILSGILCAGMLLINLPGIVSLIKFGIQYFPLG